MSPAQQGKARKWELPAMLVALAVIPYLLRGRVGLQGENAAQYLARGRGVAVDGKLSWREAKTEQGRREFIEVVADSVQFLSSGQANGQGGEDPQMAGGDQGGLRGNPLLDDPPGRDVPGVRTQRAPGRSETTPARAPHPPERCAGDGPAPRGVFLSPLREPRASSCRPCSRRRAGPRRGAAGRMGAPRRPSVLRRAGGGPVRPLGEPPSEGERDRAAGRVEELARLRGLVRALPVAARRVLKQGPMAEPACGVCSALGAVDGCASCRGCAVVYGVVALVT